MQYWVYMQKEEGLLQKAMIRFAIRKRNDYRSDSDFLHQQKNSLFKRYWFYLHNFIHQQKRISIKKNSDSICEQKIHHKRKADSICQQEKIQYEINTDFFFFQQKKIRRKCNDNSVHKKKIIIKAMPISFSSRKKSTMKQCKIHSPSDKILQKQPISIHHQRKIHL